MPNRTRELLAAGLLLFSACFNATDLDLTSGAPESDTSSESEGQESDATGSGGHPSGSSSSTGDITGDPTTDDETGSPPALSCDPAIEPPVTDSVFVSPAGDDAIGAGNPVSPFTTLTRALERAVAESRTRIILDVGTYGDNVDITASHSGIAIEGGWVRDGVTWTRNCDAEIAESTIVVGVDPARPTIALQDGASLIAFRSLSIATVEEAPASADDQPGASLTAVHVVGQQVDVTFDNVVIRSGAAGSGGSPSGRTGVTVTTCNGRNDCDDGANGAPGATSPPAQPGTYGPTGYQPGNGHPGSNGSPGAHGTSGEPGESNTQCHVSCQMVAAGVCETIRETQTAQSGACGCGGNGGLGGSRGQGGGASTALLVTGEEAHVVVRASKLISGNGGAGGQGGPPGQPAQGSTGASGLNTSCEVQGCVYDVNGDFCGQDGIQNATISGGGPGGVGGRGGSGSPGTGGAGGPSCPIATTDPQALTIDEVTTESGLLGAGSGGAPDGATSQCGLSL